MCIGTRTNTTAIGPPRNSTHTHTHTRLPSPPAVPCPSPVPHPTHPRPLPLVCSVPSQFRNADLSSTAELPLTVDPGFGGAVFWNSRQVGGAWGGWFRITAPGSGSLTLGICGGCGQNVVGKGYYFGNGFSITFNSFTT